MSLAPILGFLVVEAYIVLMGLTLGLLSRRRDSRAFRAKLAPYTHKS
jgi:hypothetical protein